MAFPCCDRFGRAWGFYVMTEYTSCRDREFQNMGCCDRALGTQRHALEASTIVVCAIEACCDRGISVVTNFLQLFCRDRDFSIATDLSSSKKKKKKKNDPQDLGRHTKNLIVNLDDKENNDPSIMNRRLYRD